MRKKAYERQCPCINCIRVPDPKLCDNKSCAPWRHWFVGRWDWVRRQLGCCDGNVCPLEKGEER